MSVQNNNDDSSDSTVFINWLYPINDSHPIRQYQLNITECSLYHNTLICLPTGII